MDNHYYQKYLKYKSKYLEIKKDLEQNGGGKRMLKQETESDPLLITPIGQPNSKLSSFFLKPEINFIKKKCGKDKSCNEQNINLILTEVYKSEQTGQKIDVNNFSKSNKISQDLINNIIKFHKIWKSEHFLKIEK